jgi:hypothetical protein
MKTRVTQLLCLLLLASRAEAKDKPRIRIQVVESQTSERQFSYQVPGRNGQSTTTCDSSATATDLGGGTATARGTTNCTTTTTPSTPPKTVVRSIPQAHVRAILPDGSRVTLWCQQGLRRCSPLGPGTYDAEVSGNSAWVYTRELDGGERKIKYRSVGGW